jgi:hypothetical protein
MAPIKDVAPTATSMNANIRTGLWMRSTTRCDRGSGCEAYKESSQHYANA